MGTDAGLSIAVDDGVSVAALGDRLAYTISVHNDGHAGSGHLGITFTPPAGVELSAADADGAIKGGSANWTVTVGAAKTVTLKVSARVAELPEGAKGLAAVACVADGGVPKLCATDINQIPGRDDIHATQAAATATHDTGYPWVQWAAGTGLGLVALALVAALVVRRRRATR